MTQNLKQFLADGQDETTVSKTLDRVGDFLTPGEEIAYIAVQKGLMGVRMSPASVVATNRRFIIFRPQLLGGATFEDHNWVDLINARVSEGMTGATLSLSCTNGLTYNVDSLPKPQARKLYAYAQQMEERMRHHRREQELEMKRAESGAYIVPTVQPQASTPAAPPTPDPVERLSKLKVMLDNNLITQDEYDSQKARILADL